MNFISSENIMNDFRTLSKDEFLEMYKSFDNYDYEDTVKILDNIEKLKESNIKDIRTATMKIIEGVDEFVGFDIAYILKAPKNSESLAFITDKYDESGREIYPFADENRYTIFNVPDWDYNFDTYIFENLQKGYRIEYMDEKIHYGIWCEIDNLYEYDDIVYKKGVQNYLRYCIKNNITKEFIDEVSNRTDTPDIMRFYEKEIKKNKPKER